MFQIVTALAGSLIRLLEFLLLARAIMSWFPQMHGSKLYELLFEVTEPIIIPFRSLLNRFDAIRMFPLDIAYLCAFIALEALSMILYRI